MGHSEDNWSCLDVEQRSLPSCFKNRSFSRFACDPGHSRGIPEDLHSEILMSEIKFPESRREVRKVGFPLCRFQLFAVSTRFMLCRAGNLAGQKVTSSRRHRTLALEYRLRRQTRTEAGTEGAPRTPKAGPLLPVVARLRQIREPGGARPLPRGQPPQGDTGAEPAGEGVKRGTSLGATAQMLLPVVMILVITPERTHC